MPITSVVSANESSKDFQALPAADGSHHPCHRPALFPLAIGKSAYVLTMNRRRRKKLARDFDSILKNRTGRRVDLDMVTMSRVSRLFDYFLGRSRKSRFEEFTKFYLVGKASGTHAAAGETETLSPTGYPMRDSDW